MTSFRGSLYDKRKDIADKQKRRSGAFERWRNIALGEIFSVNGSVDIPYKNGYVWVHEWGVPESPAMVFKGGVTVSAGDWVKMARDPKDPHLWQIIDMWVGAQNTGDYNLIIRQMVGEHGENHQYPSESSPGPDLVLIYRAAIQEFKLTGNGSTLVVTVQPGRYIFNGVPKDFVGGTYDLTSSVPGAGLVRRTLVYVDEASKLIQIVDGATVSSAGAVPIPFPTVPADVRVCGFVTLTNGQTDVTTADDVEDWRDLTDASSINSMPAPTAFGQFLLYDESGIRWGLPVISEDGTWMVGDDDRMIVS